MKQQEIVWLIICRSLSAFFRMRFSRSFSSSSQISWQLRKYFFQTPFSRSQREVFVQRFHRYGRKSGKETLLTKFIETFWTTWFFRRNILKNVHFTWILGTSGTKVFFEGRVEPGVPSKHSERYYLQKGWPNLRQKFSANKVFLRKNFEIF